MCVFPNLEKLEGMARRQVRNAFRLPRMRILEQYVPPGALPGHPDPSDQPAKPAANHRFMDSLDPFWGSENEFFSF